MHTHVPHFGRKGFTIIETLMVMGVMGVVSAIVAPLYHQYQLQNDLSVATEQVSQGLSRARLLAQTAQGDSGWGFFVPSGTLYKGTSYATRDVSSDEVYPMPSNIAMNGLYEVAYSKYTGAPSATGSITLDALDHSTHIVLIQVQNQAVAVVQANNLTICHAPLTLNQTMIISDAQWPGLQAKGDTLGACVF